MMINRKLAQMIEDVPVEAVMHDWWIAMVASAFGKIGYIEEPLMLYRQHSSNDTGAKRYGLGYFVKRFTQKISFEKYTTQAKNFLELYDELLDEKERTLLKDFSKIDMMGWLEKRIFLSKQGVLKNGFVRNVGLIWKV